MNCVCPSVSWYSIAADINISISIKAWVMIVSFRHLSSLNFLNFCNQENWWTGKGVLLMPDLEVLYDEIFLGITHDLEV
jgi:hypothetical protein